MNVSSAIRDLRLQAQTYLSNDAAADDAPLRDVVERWEVSCNGLAHSHHTGTVSGGNCRNSISDVTLQLMAFRYPLLQPVDSTGELLPFSGSKSVVLFHVCHEGKTGTKFLGRAACPVSALVDESGCDGDQTPRCVVLRITKPSAAGKRTTTPSKDGKPPLQQHDKQQQQFGERAESCQEEEEEGFVGELQLVLGVSTPSSLETPWEDLDATHQHNLESLLGMAPPLPPLTSAAAAGGAAAEDGGGGEEQEQAKASLSNKKHEHRSYLGQLRKAKQLFLDLQTFLEAAVDQVKF